MTRQKASCSKVKGKIKEIAGQVSMNPDLETEGKDEILAGKAHENIGQVKRSLENRAVYHGPARL